MRDLLRRFAFEFSHLGHHGSCCTFDDNGKTIVTPESCVCYPVEREVFFEFGDFKDTLRGWNTPAPAPSGADGGEGEGK